jgi:hypothetical protein
MLVDSGWLMVDLITLVSIAEDQSQCEGDDRRVCILYNTIKMIQKVEHENEAQKETPPRYDETNALHNHRQPRVRGSERRPGGVCYYSMIEYYVVRRLWSNACVIRKKTMAKL